MADRVLQALGRKVRQLRAEQGSSQEELADRCGLHRTYVGGIERGERNPTLRNLVVIARALGITVSRLVDEVDQ